MRNLMKTVEHHQQTRLKQKCKISLRRLDNSRKTSKTLKTNSKLLLKSLNRPPKLLMTARGEKCYFHKTSCSFQLYTIGFLFEIMFNRFFLRFETLPYGNPRKKPNFYNLKLMVNYFHP